MSHLEMIEITMCLKGFRHAHTAAARMCLACCFLQGIMALAGAQTLLKQFEERAKVAREAPIDRNVENLGFFLKENSACSRKAVFQFCGCESHMFSYVFLMSHLENVENTVCSQGFRHARAADARVCTL